MKAKIGMIISMLIFGSIGLFVRRIELTSSQIALYRGVIGSVFLIITSMIVKNKLSWNAIKPNAFLLLTSGAAIGFNWIFLFEAYKYTTIANATLSYYFAPVFVMLLSPVILKEKLSKIKLCSILVATFGMFLIVDTSNIGGLSRGNIKGIGFGLIAATLYASVILINKFLKKLTGLETTIVQLMMAAIVLLPYVLMTEKLSFYKLSGNSFLLLIVVGLLHTGIAYLLYFTSFQQLSGQTIAVFSYIDPIAAILLSSVFLRETMTILQIMGGLFILGATFINEIHKSK